MMILVVAGLVALIGFAALAVDMGYLYSERAKMVTAADAAALAGVQKLVMSNDSSGSEQWAREIAKENGADENKIDVHVDTGAKEVEVQVGETKNLFFARVLGRQQSDVGARAKARAGIFVGGKNIVPFGVEKQYWESGEEGILKLGAGDGENGNYLALDFNRINTQNSGNNGNNGGNNNSGANFYEKNLKYGYDGEIKIGDTIKPQPGNMSGSTIEAVNYRINNGERVIIVPIVSEFQEGASEDVTVLGFAAFYLEDVIEKNNEPEQGAKKGEVRGRFLNYVSPGNIGEGPEYGLYAVKLVE